MSVSSQTKLYSTLEILMLETLHSINNRDTIWNSKANLKSIKTGSQLYSFYHKGSVKRFSTHGFFHRSTPPLGPWFTGYSRFEYGFVFVEIFDSKFAKSGSGGLNETPGSDFFQNSSLIITFSSNNACDVFIWFCFGFPLKGIGGNNRFRGEDSRGVIRFPQFHRDRGIRALQTIIWNISANTKPYAKWLYPVHQGPRKDKRLFDGKKTRVENLETLSPLRYFNNHTELGKGT
jgi:hypothetical protein